MREHHKSRLTLFLEPELDRRLRAEARRNNVTIGRYVTHLLLSRPGVAIRNPVEARKVARRLAKRGMSQRAIADSLNQRGYRTTYGMRWSQMSVSRLLRS